MHRSVGWFIDDLYSFNDLSFARKLQPKREYFVGVRFSDETFDFESSEKLIPKSE